MEIKSIFLLCALLFSIQSFGFDCNPKNYMKVANDKTSQVNKKWQDVFKKTINDWLAVNNIEIKKEVVAPTFEFDPPMVVQKAVNGNPAIYESGEVRIKGFYFVKSKKGSLIRFELSEGIFIGKSIHPLDNSIHTCGPKGAHGVIFLVKIYKVNPHKKDILLDKALYMANLETLSKQWKLDL